jgi:hypothetical protein
MNMELHVERDYRGANPLARFLPALCLGAASNNKVSVSAINAPNPVRHSGNLLAGI